MDNKSIDYSDSDGNSDSDKSCGTNENDNSSDNKPTNFDLENATNSENGDDSSEDEKMVTEESENVEDFTGNKGLADVMSKILNTKRPKNKKTIVLAKAKKISNLKSLDKPVEEGFEIVGENNEPKADLEENNKTIEKTKIDSQTKKILLEYKINKKKIDSRGRTKPSILNREKERELSKIATKGIIQLFNAVHKQQNLLNSKLNTAGKSLVKRDKIMKEISNDKKSFLDIIVNSGINQKAEEKEDNEIKTEPESSDDGDDAPSNNWSVLRQDFMQKANLKDWDKEEQ